MTIDTEAGLVTGVVTGSVTGDVTGVVGDVSVEPVLDGEPPAHPKEARQSSMTTHAVGIQGRIDSPI
ncbi:MAG: hypothetical protein WBF45_17780 [Acidobacteriaceae bacterium]